MFIMYSCEKKEEKQISANVSFSDSLKSPQKALVSGLNKHTQSRHKEYDMVCIVSININKNMKYIFCIKHFLKSPNLNNKVKCGL